MTEKMNKMLEIIKSHHMKLLSNSYKRYFAPEIPDKILKKIIKNFDDYVHVNNIIAFFDTTVFNSGKEGLLFTTDGLYIKSLFKPDYIRYKDIIYVDHEKKNPVIQVRGISDVIKIYAEINDTSAFIHMMYSLRDIDREHGQTSIRASGKVKKMDMPDEMKKKCHGFIHAAAVGAGAAGAGLAQAIAADNAIIVPIQVTMITTMGKQVFDLDITEAMAKSIIASAGATIAGRTASQFLVGWIPVVGNAVNTATAASVTEMIGWIAANDFYKRWLQDQNKGRIAAQKQGYELASAEYEIKLRKQADEFLNQKKEVKKLTEEYEKLLDEYEKHIAKLEEENALFLKVAELKEELHNLKSLHKEI